MADLPWVDRDGIQTLEDGKHKAPSILVGAGCVNPFLTQRFSEEEKGGKGSSVLVTENFYPKESVY